MKKLREKVELIFYVNGHEVLNEERAKLLLLINELGSILSASKVLKIPYTRAWEHIMKIENIIGSKVIDAKRGGRGGGGTKLTEDGLKLLHRYMISYSQKFGKELEVSFGEIEIRKNSIIYIGSDDILLRQLIRLLKDQGYRVESYYLGSLKGIASLLLEESDFTGIHLYDPLIDDYNVPYLRGYIRGFNLVIVKGYKRLQGFVTREKVSLEETVNRLFSGRYRFINRNPGSGTRVLIDYILKKYQDEKGVNSPLNKIIKGYDEYVNTHLDVASMISEGYADVGVCIKWSAKYFNLNFIPLKWEEFDFVLREDRGGKRLANAISKALSTNEFREITSKFDGYKLHNDTGKILKL